ncbi:MAG TPA: CotH kinase family protein, partial [Planctomycetota bacterium]|nr:CotH kinase family protein [Planctomycetota bacterium]
MKRTLLLLTFVVSALGQTPSLYDPDTIRDLHLTFPQTNYWTLLTNNYASQTEIPADLVVEGVTYPSVAVRFRGNTSYTQLPSGSQKKSFNIRMDVYTPGQKLLGYEHLNLNNGFHDPTFVREFLAYR